MRTLPQRARRVPIQSLNTWHSYGQYTNCCVVSASRSRRSARSCRRACGSARSCSTSRWCRPGDRLAHRHRGGAPLVADQLVLAQELVALVAADQRVERAARPREKRRAQPLHRRRRQAQVVLQERRVADRLQIEQARDRQRARAPARAAGRRPRPSSGSSAASPPGGRRPNGRPRRCGCGSPPCTRGIAPGPGQRARHLQRDGLDRHRRAQRVVGHHHHRARLRRTTARRTKGRALSSARQ